MQPYSLAPLTFVILIGTAKMSFGSTVRPLVGYMTGTDGSLNKTDFDSQFCF